MAKAKGGKHATDGTRILVRNRRAKHDYQLHDTFEAGIVLVGSEVKSLRDAGATLSDGYVDIHHGEAWLQGVKINEYPWANQFNHEPLRRRKLLLHRREIDRLAILAQQRGYTIVPLSMYLKGGKIKVEIATATGKRQYEKRDSAREADAKREIAQAMKHRR